MATTLGNGKRFGSPMMTAASKRAENRTIENLRFNMQSTDRKSTRLNSSHDQISYAVFCLKKKKKGALHPINRRLTHITANTKHPHSCGSLYANRFSAGIERDFETCCSCSWKCRSDLRRRF